MCLKSTKTVGSLLLNLKKKRPLTQNWEISTKHTLLFPVHFWQEIQCMRKNKVPKRKLCYVLIVVSKFLCRGLEYVEKKVVILNTKSDNV